MVKTRALISGESSRWHGLRANQLLNSTLLAGLLSLLLGSCSEPAGSPPAPPPAVTVAPVVQKQITTSYEFVGRTEAVAAVDLRARVKGFLEKRDFTEGSDVSAGKRLFLIERAPYEAAVDRSEARLAQARATLNKAQKDVQRLQPLHRRGVVTDAQLDEAVAVELEAQAAVQEAEAELRQAKLDLSYTEIKAPIAGRMGRAKIDVGNLVGPDSGVLATLIKLDPIYVTFNVSERDVLDYKQEQMARQASSDETSDDLVPRLRLANDAVYPYKGTIDFLSNMIDQTTGTVPVRIVFPNPNKLLLPGQYVTVFLEGREPETKLTVPQAAIQQDQAGTFVLVVNDDNQAEVRRVVVGQRSGTDWVIEQGLGVGERVIFQGLQKVRPGITVAPTTAKPTQPIES